ncbi:alkaline phosphatase family protein [Nonomuraea sp. NPDC050556]|uniref:alkaline phosphatase family protein n=1 Tax=Nonomuraea sp. NPDC050556 TaxID=3364369 RepID=UPI0037A719EC
MRLLAVAAALLLAGCSTPARTTPGPATPSAQSPTVQVRRAKAAKAPKVLVIGLDGVRYDRMLEARIPYLREMMRSGTLATGLLDLPNHVKSVSGPGWATVLTGVEPEKHGVYDNSFNGRKFTKYPDFLTRIEKLRPRLSTVAVAAWRSLLETGAVGALVDWHATTHNQTYARGAKDALIIRRMTEILRTRQVDVAFLHLDTVDSTAHRMGAMGQEYLDAIDTMDASIGRLFAAIRARPGFAAEDWTVIVTTDHGHKDQGGHGGRSDIERGVFVLAAGPGIPQGLMRDGVRLVDVAATVFGQMGLPLPKELTGKSLAISR